MSGDANKSSNERWVDAFKKRDWAREAGCRAAEGGDRQMCRAGFGPSDEDDIAPLDDEAARRLLEENGWRCIPPHIKENVAYWTNDGTPHGA